MTANKSLSLTQMIYLKIFDVLELKSHERKKKIIEHFDQSQNGKVLFCFSYSLFFKITLQRLLIILALEELLQACKQKNNKSKCAELCTTNRNVSLKPFSP
jgi:hypothetical protein